MLVERKGVTLSEMILRAMVASAPNAACIGEVTEGDMGQMWVGVLSSCFEIFPRQVRLRSPLVSHMSHRPAIQLRSGSEEARSNKSIPRGGAFGVDPMISGPLQTFSRSIHFLRPSHKLLQTVVTLLISFPWFPCYSLISGMG